MKLRLESILFAVLFCCLLFGCQKQSRVSAPLLGSSSALGDSDTAAFVQHVNEIVPALLDRHQVPGAAIALIREGEMVWVQGFGLANIEAGVSVTPDTVFRVASISKTVTAWAVMHLVEKGKIDLHAPVERYLTRWHLPPSPFDPNQVTVFRLLSHTAGLNVHGYGRGVQPQPLPSLEQSLANTKVKTIQEPGSSFLYSGGGYTVLQLMIEQVTGEVFADYVQGEILEPLGMDHSSFYDSRKVLSRLSIAYDENGQICPPRQFTEQAAAGLYATAQDLARFVAAGLRGPHGEKPGRGILRPETLQLMYTPAPATDGGYGLGYQTGFDRTPVVGNSGDNPGWESVFVALPELDEGIVSLTNSDNGEAFNAELIQLWSDWLTAIYTARNAQ